MAITPYRKYLHVDCWGVTTARADDLLRLHQLVTVVARKTLLQEVDRAQEWFQPYGVTIAFIGQEGEIVLRTAPTEGYVGISLSVGHAVAWGSVVKLIQDSLSAVKVVQTSREFGSPPREPVSTERGEASAHVVSRGAD